MLNSWELWYPVKICFWSLLQQEKNVLHQNSGLRGKQLEIIGSPKIYCAENKVRFLLFLHSYPHQLPAMLESSGLYKLCGSGGRDTIKKFQFNARSQIFYCKPYLSTGAFQLQIGEAWLHRIYSYAIMILIINNKILWNRKRGKQSLI